MKTKVYWHHTFSRW